MAGSQRTRIVLGGAPPALLLAGLLLPSSAPPVSDRPVLLADTGRTAWIDVPVEPPSRPIREMAELGAGLYGWNCLPCHGPDGEGDGPHAKRLGLRPRDLRRGLFRFKTSVAGEMPFDEDLYRTITLGVPTSGMPSYGHFDPDDRWALVHHVKTLSVSAGPDGRVRNRFDSWPARARAELPPPPPSRPDGPARGEWLFREGAGCASCHGPDGRGDGPAAASLVDSFGRPMTVPDMTRGEVLFKAGSGPADIYRVLTVGMPGTPMPSFAALPPRDRWDLAFHVAGLYRPVHPGEKVYLWKGCINCHTIGKGRHLGPDLAGVADRRDPDWIRRWIKEPDRLIATDPEARALVGQYGLPMPDLKLSDAEVEAVVDYLRTASP